MTLVLCSSCCLVQWLSALPVIRDGYQCCYGYCWSIQILMDSSIEPTFHNLVQKEQTWHKKFKCPCFFQGRTSIIVPVYEEAVTDTNLWWWALNAFCFYYQRKATSYKRIQVLDLLSSRQKYMKKITLLRWKPNSWRYQQSMHHKINDPWLSGAHISSRLIKLWWLLLLRWRLWDYCRT